MKILITCLLLFTSQLFSQTYLNVFYSNSTPTNSSDITQVQKITFGSSGMNFVLTNNSTVSKDVNTISKLTFGAVAFGSQLPVELTSFTAGSKDRSVNLKWSTATEVNTLRFEVQRTNVTNSVIGNWITLGIINAHVNSNSTKIYSYTDNIQDAGKYSYRLKIVDKDGSFKFTESVNAIVAVPDKFDLKQNYPNPFNPSTVISYSLPFDCNVRMNIYDVAGRLVREAVNENQKAGYHDFNFNAGNLSSGIYFYSVIAVSSDGQKNFSSVKKFALIK